MTKRPRKPNKHVLDQILIGTIGLILSFALHELFHIFMHWGEITHVDFFPNAATVVQIDAVLPDGYDRDGEEIAAYGITLLVLLITVMIIFKIRDTNDSRSASQILFPKDNTMQKMDPSKMLKLSGLDEARVPKKKRSKRRAKTL